MGIGVLKLNPTYSKIAHLNVKPHLATPMRALIKGKRSRAYLDVSLEPGERLLTSVRALGAVDAEMSILKCFRGGFWRALVNKVFGGENWYLQWLANNQPRACALTLAHYLPGEIICVHLDNHTISLQAGAFIAATPGINLTLEYAGLISWLAKEGMFRTRLSGTGSLWFGGVGALVERTVDGQLIVDQRRLVSYDLHLRAEFNWQGKILGILFGTESASTRLLGNGKVVLQASSAEHLAKLLELG